MYDLIIVGGGPAGIAAAIYGGRYGLKTIIISDIIGGEIALSSVIENYPGFKKISGVELSDKWKNHIKSVGVEIKNAKVSEIKKEGDVFEVGADDDQLKSKSIILATGMKRRELGVPGEKEFRGKGVAYCATCDGPLFRGKIVVVVGGGNAGAESALFLSDIAKKIYLVEMQEELLADESLVAKIKEKQNIEIITSNQITKIKGDQIVKSVILGKEFNGQKELTCEGIFIEIGSEPDPTLAKSAGVEVDEKGFIEVKSDQSTNILGLYAAGDSTTGSNFFWQVITAMAEGAIAADSVNKYITEGK